MNTFQRTTLKDLPLRSAFVTEAVIVSHLDPDYMGTLLVEIVSYTGSNVRPERSGQLMTAHYLSPFYGVTPFKGVQPNDAYRFTQQSYGFWAIPPDVGTRVLVLFAEGQSAYGYWIGCIPDEGMNFMVPDPRAVTELTTEATPDNLKGLKLPTGEYNKLLENGESIDYNFFLKPYNKDFTEVLEVQGLLYDETRGLSTSSARREAPSMVFGWSSPGPKDKRTGSPDTTYGDSENASTDKYSRLGGSSIVMDDGDDKFIRATHASAGPPYYVNKEAAEEGGDETIPYGEGIRIRTRTGHQILLSNSEDLIYIGNSRGTAWIELTSDGKIDIHARDSISLFTAQDFNLTAERDVNIEAGRNINMRADGRWYENPEIRTGEVTIEADRTFTAHSGKNSSRLSFGDNFMKMDVSGSMIINSKDDMHMRSEKSMYQSSEFSMHQYSKGDIYRKASKASIDESENLYLQVGNAMNVTAGGDIRESAGGNKETQAVGSANITSGEMNLKSKSGMFMEGRNTIGINSGGGVQVSSVQPIYTNTSYAPSQEAKFASKAAVGTTGNSPREASSSSGSYKLPKITLDYIVPGTIEPVFYDSIVPRAPQHEPYYAHENNDPLQFVSYLTDREILAQSGGYQYIKNMQSNAVQAELANTQPSTTDAETDVEEIKKDLNNDSPSNNTQDEAEKTSEENTTFSLEGITMIAPTPEQIEAAEKERNLKTPRELLEEQRFKEDLLSRLR